MSPTDEYYVIPEIRIKELEEKEQEVKKCLDLVGTYVENDEKKIEIVESFEKNGIGAIEIKIKKYINNMENLKEFKSARRLFRTMYLGFAIDGHPCIYSESQLKKDSGILYETWKEPITKMNDDLQDLNKNGLLELIKTKKNNYIVPTVKGLSCLETEPGDGEVEKLLEIYKIFLKSGVLE